MKGMRESVILITVLSGLLMISTNVHTEKLIPDNIGEEEIFYEPEDLSESINLLPEEQDSKIELIPEIIVYSPYYDMLTGQRLTEKEVLEALQGLLKSEHAVERALAVNIARTNHIQEVLFSALSDTDEAVQNEAEFFIRGLLLSRISY